MQTCVYLDPLQRSCADDDPYCDESAATLAVKMQASPTDSQHIRDMSVLSTQSRNSSRAAVGRSSTDVKERLHTKSSMSLRAAALGGSASPKLAVCGLTVNGRSYANIDGLFFFFHVLN